MFLGFLVSPKMRWCSGWKKGVVLLQGLPRFLISALWETGNVRRFQPLLWRFWALRRCHRKCSGRVRHVSYEGQHVNISPFVWKLSYCYAGWRKGFTASSHQPVGQHWQWQGICAYGGSRVSFWWISLMNCKEDGTRCETKLRFLSFESNAK